MYKRVCSIVLLFALCMGVFAYAVSAKAVNINTYHAPAQANAAGTAQAAATGSAATIASAATTVSAAKTTAAAPAASASRGQSTTARTSTSASAKTLSQIFKDKGINPAKAVISIFVDKSDHTLSILANGAVMKSYHVELGDKGLGDKKVSGDHKTPEGTFYIAEKSVLSPPDYYLGTRWMRLSYPNIEDAERGLSQGLINKSTYNRIVSAIQNGEIPPQDTALGGGVGIHGGSVPSFGSNWTWGCVGLTNKDVEDFYSYIKVGTKVVIKY